MGERRRRHGSHSAGSDGPDVPRCRHQHPRPHHQRDRCAKRIRGHGRLQLRWQQHLRRDRWVSSIFSILHRTPTYFSSLRVSFRYLREHSYHHARNFRSWCTEHGRMELKEEYDSLTFDLRDFWSTYPRVAIGYESNAHRS